MDRLVEREALAAAGGRDLQLHVGELPGAAGLLLVAVVHVHLLGDGLAQGRRQSGLDRLDAKVLGHGLTRAAQVQHPLTRKHMSPGLGIVADGQ